MRGRVFRNQQVQFVGADVLANTVVHAFMNTGVFRFGCMGFSVCIVCYVNRVGIAKEKIVREKIVKKL